MSIDAVRGSTQSFDGWGGTFEYRFDGTELQSYPGYPGYPVLGVRSGRRDKVVSTGQYPVGPFVATDYDQDIVWVDGYFINYPAGAQVGNPSS